MMIIFDALFAIVKTDVFLSFGGILIAFALIMLILNAFSVGSPTKRL